MEVLRLHQLASSPVKGYVGHPKQKKQKLEKPLLCSLLSSVHRELKVGQPLSPSKNFCTTSLPTEITSACLGLDHP